MNVHYHQTYDAADMTMFAKSKPLNFDKVDTSAFGGADFMPAGYGGLTWSAAWAVMKPSEFAADYPNSGYFTGITSGSQIAFNGGVDENGNPQPLEISAKSFDIAGLNLTAAWDKKMTVEIVAYQKGDVVYDQTFTVNAKGPLHIDLDLKKIDDITFTATEIKVDKNTGGGAGAFMVFDDIEVSNVKSLPSGAFVTDHHASAPVMSGHMSAAHFAVPHLDGAHMLLLA